MNQEGGGNNPRAKRGVPMELRMRRAGNGETNERESAKLVPPDPPHGETNGPPSRRPGYPHQRRLPFPASPIQPRLQQLRLPFDEM